MLAILHGLLAAEDAATEGKKVITELDIVDSSDPVHSPVAIPYTFVLDRDRTEVRFTHSGLRPEVECFEACSNAWSYFVNDSLRRRIGTA